MSRLAAIALLLVGAVLLVTWVVAPADSAPQQPVDVPPIAPDRTSSGHDVEPVHLSRLDVPLPAFSGPRRDPFSFGSAARETTTAAPDRPGTIDAPSAPALVLPTLIAVVMPDANDPSTFRAALSETGADVRVLATGDRIGALTVGTIYPDAVLLIDPADGASHRLSLGIR